MITETTYVVSSLSPDSVVMGKLVKHPNKENAISAAKAVIRKRHAYGEKPLEYYVLKVEAVVRVSEPQLEVLDL